MCKSKSEVDSNEKNASLLEDKRENVVSNAPDKLNEMLDLGVTVAQAVVEDGVDGESTENDDVEEELFVGRACNDNDVVSGRLASSKSARLPNSQGSRSFELERCSGLKVDGCVNLNAGADMLKDCSCSFCLKAAYIWTDLHYQDIKGRISALKKSQKDASFLVQKYGRGKEADMSGMGNTNQSSKLESDLMSQWRSLFLHMEDIFGQESSQLQASFVTLKDLRENCKTDLERTTGMPSD
ncbi:DNA-directed RNA polymerase subunit beta [Melia azedarach]|nr:DNA-directed RNA polymerase subunit beta [Melia azedarach]